MPKSAVLDAPGVLFEYATPPTLGFVPAPGSPAAYARLPSAVVLLLARDAEVLVGVGDDPQRVGLRVEVDAEAACRSGGANGPNAARVSPVTGLTCTARFAEVTAKRLSSDGRTSMPTTRSPAARPWIGDVRRGRARRLGREADEAVRHPSRRRWRLRRRRPPGRRARPCRHASTASDVRFMTVPTAREGHRL